MTVFHSANGARFFAKDDMIVSWCRKTGQQFEPMTTAWMFDVMENRLGSFVDVGASTGWFSIPMALRGFHVIAFEPNARALRRLVDNSAENGVDLDIWPYAASDKTGEATFWHNPLVPLTSGGSIEVATCRTPKTETVQTMTLDEAISDEPVALLKVDVEGHEISVLNGARKIIERDRPHMVLEANTEAHRDRIVAWLDDIGDYVWRNADQRNVLCTPQVLP